MDRGTTQPTIEPALLRFARRLQEQFSAERVLLFGSHARGHAQPDSDYDLIIVSGHFAGIHLLRRGFGLKQLFYQEGGNSPMDLICLTPEEFEQAQNRISLVAAVLPEAIDLLRVTTSPA